MRRTEGGSFTFVECNYVKYPGHTKFQQTGIWRRNGRNGTTKTKKETYFALNILFILLCTWYVCICVRTCVVEQHFLPARKLQLQRMQLESGTICIPLQLCNILFRYNTHIQRIYKSGIIFKLYKIIRTVENGSQNWIIHSRNVDATNEVNLANNSSLSLLEIVPSKRELTINNAGYRKVRYRNKFWVNRIIDGQETTRQIGNRCCQIRFACGERTQTLWRL